MCVIHFNRYIDALRYGTYVESSKSEMINTAQEIISSCWVQYDKNQLLLYRAVIKKWRVLVRDLSIYVGRWSLLKDGVRTLEEFTCSYATREELLLLLLAGRGEITYEAVGTLTGNQILL